MSGYNNGRGGGGRAPAPPKVYIPLGGMWVGQSDNWSAKSGNLKILTEETWILDAMLLPSAKIAVFTNDRKDTERHPDLNLCLSLDESEAPDEYFQWKSNRDAQYGGGGRAPAPPRQAPVRGADRPGVYRQPEAAPRQAPGRGGYAAPERGGGRGEYAPRQAQTPARGRGREVPQDTYDGEDPFEG